MSNNRLSHSAVSRYQQCPKSFELHYQKRLRPKTQSAALLFGSAVDAGISALLKNEDPIKAFKYLWTFAEINGEQVFLQDCTIIAYSDGEYDFDLLDKGHQTKLEAKYGVDLEQQAYNTLKEKKQVGLKGLTEDQRLLLNNVFWGILYTKGLLMIEAFKTKIMPRIETVLSVQEMVELKNDEGDSIVGYVDLVAQLYEYGSPVILDVKTSSIDYQKDSVASSPQLTIYKHALQDKYQTDLAGFLVLKKRINKNKVKICGVCENDGTGKRHKSCDAEIKGQRCGGEWIETIKPEVDVQFIVDKIPPRFEEIVVENYVEINQAIKNGSFTRNLSSCVRPWGRCEFYDLCHHNDSSNLEDMSLKPPTERKL